MIHYKADIRSLLFVALYFTVAIAPWFLWQSLNNYEIAAFVVANCFFSFSCAVIVHNTIHKPIFKSRVLNRMMQLALSLTYGHPVSAFVAGHNFSHHKYTQKPKDAMRTSKMRFSLNILNQLLFLPRMSGDILVAEIRFAKKMRLENPAWFRQYLFELALVLGVKVVAFIINWKCALLFMILPHYYAAWGIVGTNYFQHDGCDEDHPYNHSRSFSSKYLNWFLFNNGYHGAHHQRPALHWSLLPEYHDKEIRPFLHPSLDRVSLFAYLWQAHVYPGKRIDYLGKPIQLSPPEKEEDWVADVNPSLHREDLAGAA
jgi:fatty acid desaturase